MVLLSSLFYGGGTVVERYLSKFRPFSIKEVSSLFCDEIIADINFENLSEYSAETAYTVFDQVFEVKELHGFRQRFMVSLSKPVVDSQHGFVFDKNLHLLQESSTWPSGHLLNARIQKPPKREIVEIPYRINLLTSNGFYHWLIEDLPTFLSNGNFAGELEVGLYEGAPKYVKSFAAEFYPRYLALPKYFSPLELVLTTKTHDTGWPHSKDIRILREFFSEKMSPESTSKIYLSRTRSNRSPIWEIELQNKLESSGWEILYAEDLTFSQQISRISGASILCGVHGAGLANAVWMQNGSTLIELTPKNYRNCFSNLAQVNNISYRYISMEKSLTDIVKEIEINAKL